VLRTGARERSAWIFPNTCKETRRRKLLARQRRLRREDWPGGRKEGGIGFHVATEGRKRVIPSRRPSVAMLRSHAVHGKARTRWRREKNFAPKIPKLVRAETQRGMPYLLGACMVKAVRPAARRAERKEARTDHFQVRPRWDPRTPSM
jgi:hypothetical protein